MLDRTTGQTLIATNTTDVKELKGSTSQVMLWNRTLQLTQVVLGRGVTFGGAQIWRQWAGHRTGGGWINPQSLPQLNRYYGPLQPVTATLIPEAGHVYEAWSVAAQGACRLDYWRWSRALFGVGQQLTPTAQPTCPGGICVPPTPLPTPTPPPPPVPSAALATRLALHSRYDPVSSWNGTTEGQQSATDAVNISQNLHVVWPMDEPLDWTPRVTLTPIPEQVMNDPWYGHIRYTYTQEILGWNYGGSVGQTTAMTGCHGGTTVPIGEGSGCRSAYLNDAELNETTPKAGAVASMSAASERGSCTSRAGNRPRLLQCLA